MHAKLFRGLSFNSDPTGISYIRFKIEGGSELTSTDVPMYLFDISYNQARAIFFPEGYFKLRSYTSPTPLGVAKRIEQFVKTGQIK